MSKGLEALERIKQDLEYITRLDYVEPIVRGEVRDELYKIYHRELPELDIIETALKRLETLEEEKQSFDKSLEKKLKAFEIITKYPKTTRSLNYLLYMMTYWEKENQTITKELLETYDFPYEVEEFELLKEVLL